jgi:uncharacterized membrane protein
MNFVWWVGQILVALIFLGAGLNHSLGYERARRNPMMAWMEAWPPSIVKAIGVLEILGAIGLIAPAATGILTWLTPLAALLLGVIVALAFVFHLSRREYPNAAFNALLAVLAFAVAFGRFVVSPF